MTAPTPPERRTACPIYHGVMLEVERRRLHLGLTMEQVNDLAGTNDGYYSKMLYPDTPTGKQARWDTLQLVVDALFPDGCDVKITARPGARLSALDHKLKVLFSAALSCRRTQRELMAELGHRRAKKLPPWRRRQIARKGARARARKYRVKKRRKRRFACA